MAIKLDIDIKMEIILDEETGEYKVNSMTPKIIKQSKVQEKITIDYSLNYSELKYGILSLGAKNKIGKELPIDEKIKVVYIDKKGNEHSLATHTHKKTKGRIDKLTEVFKDLELKCGHKLEKSEVEKSKLKISYFIKEKEINISLVED